ncbi:reverse transcriptase domain-containing protein [Qipengyuania sp. RANM35]|uniref:reverse transcriptase domain-containing protein n=1 Tax=Qipengyuania sp. RANM35 TaxID=3068635 RepID=UPI0034DAE81B
MTPIAWPDFERMIKLNPLSGERPDACKVHAIRKSNGKKRVITSPGQRTRAAQKTLAMLLQARRIVSPYEFNLESKGANAAMLEIERLIIEEGRSWFVVFDFADFFSSVRPKHLEGFRLPKEVLKSVVYFNREATLTRSVNNITKLTLGGKCDPARRGMPQGAMSSGILANALLGRELRQLSGDLGIVTYVDDGVIGVRTQPEAKEVARALEKRFVNLNGGPIHFKHINIRDAREGFAYLGYWVRIVFRDGEPQVRFTPSHQSKNNFRRELFRRLLMKGPGLSWDEALEELVSYRQNWVAQKPLWRPSKHKRVEFEIETEIWVDDFFNGFTEKLPKPD